MTVTRRRLVAAQARARRSSEELLREHHRLVESGERAVVARADGNVDEGFARATHTIDAFYELPRRAGDRRGPRSGGFASGSPGEQSAHASCALGRVSMWPERLLWWSLPFSLCTAS
jgi:hypothetical protein